MKILELIYAPYELALKNPFKTSKGEIKKRKGFILNLKTSNGFTGVGDVSPFPEFGSETYEEAEKILDQIKIELAIDLNKLSESLDYNLKKLDPYPALRHGFEQALLNLISKESNISLSSLLNFSFKEQIEVNAVIGFLPPEEAVKKAVEYIDKGFKTIKLKAGRNDFSEDVKLIERIKKTAGNEIKLRIDVNGAWDLTSAVTNFRELEKYNLEYIEQPLNELNDFIELASKTKIPIAADESIRTKKDAELFIKNNAVSVIIVKPMMIGGLLPTLSIIKSAENNKIKTIVTSSFESAVGKNSAVLAAAAVNGNYAHGLAVSDHFINDLVPDPFPVNDGKISLNKNDF